MPDTRTPLTSAQNYEVNAIKTDNLFFTNISPQYPDSVFLEWKNIDNRIVENKNPIFVYDVFRSHSSEGSFDKLTGSPISDLFFFDQTIEQFSFNRTFYYKVLATSTNLTNNFTLESQITSLLSDQKGLKRRRFLEYNKIKRDRRIRLSMMNSELYYLKKNQTGTRCPDCYDIASRTRFKDKCNTCFGTTFVTSYFTPIRILVEYSQEQRSKSVSDHSYSETNAFTITMQDSPRANRDDILLDPNNDRIYKIINYQQTIMNKTPLTQILTVSELSRDSIEYQIPVDQLGLVNLYPTIDPDLENSDWPLW